MEVKKLTMLDAYPQFPWKIHRLVLRLDKSCVFIIGDKEYIEGRWCGTWEIDSNLLTLTYDVKGEDAKMEQPIVKKITVEISECKKNCPNDYRTKCPHASQTWTLSQTPCPSEMKNMPLIFYKFN